MSLHYTAILESLQDPQMGRIHLAFFSETPTLFLFKLTMENH